MFDVALKDDPAPVRLDEAAADREPESRATRAPVPAAEEGLEDPQAVLAGNSPAVVDHAYRHERRPGTTRDLHRRFGGENLIAFSIRFENTRSSCAASALTSGTSGGRVISIGWSVPKRPAADTATSYRSHQSACGATAPASILDKSATKIVDQLLPSRELLPVDRRDQLDAFAGGDAGVPSAEAAVAIAVIGERTIVGDRVKDRGLGDLRSVGGFGFGRPPGHLLALHGHVDQSRDRLGEALDELPVVAQPGRMSSQAVPLRERTRIASSPGT